MTDESKPSNFIREIILEHNRSGRFETNGYPGIFFLGARNPTVTNSTLRR